jgi:glycosyltransferase involved in cell wall biosynthesis
MVVIHSMKMGGAERVTAILANEWVAAGNDVILVTLATHEDNFYKLDSRVECISLSLGQNGTSLSRGLTANWQRIRALRRLIRQRRPEIVLGMMTTSSILSIISTRGLRCAVVSTERTYPPRSDLTPAWQILRWICFRLSDVVIVQTEKGAIWIRNNIPAKRVEVFPNAITYPIERHDPLVQPETLLDTSTKVILAVGRLSTEKGFDDLLRICIPLLSQAPDWRLVIVGDGPLADTLQEQLSVSAARHQVIFVGRVGNVSDWYERADIFAMTSHFEGFPNALAESLVHGCPAVAFDIDTGPRDLIVHGENGYLVQDRCVNTFQKLLCDLMNNEDQRKSMSLTASNLRSKLSAHQIASRWITLFKTLTIRSRKIL